jgi:hypothetical protein
MDLKNISKFFVSINDGKRFVTLPSSKEVNNLLDILTPFQCFESVDELSTCLVKFSKLAAKI